MSKNSLKIVFFKQNEEDTNTTNLSEIIYSGLILKKNYILLKKIGLENNASIWMIYQISTQLYLAMKIQHLQCHHEEITIDKNICCDTNNFKCSIYDLSVFNKMEQSNHNIANHHTIANFIMEKFKFVYKCASVKHNIWYEFKNHRWIKIDNKDLLINLISNELTSESDKNQTAYISHIIKQLNDSHFKYKIINECASIAYDLNFLKNLDENVHLVCFENGIYDLKTNNFREGRPDDYVSLCTGYDYIEYDKKDKICNDIKKFMKKIQPDKIMRKYLLTLLSTCLSGTVAETYFYILSGSGANGKSKLMELLQYSFGDYFKPIGNCIMNQFVSNHNSNHFCYATTFLILGQMMTVHGDELNLFHFYVSSLKNLITPKL